MHLSDFGSRSSPEDHIVLVPRMVFIRRFHCIQIGTLWGDLQNKYYNICLACQMPTVIVTASTVL